VQRSRETKTARDISEKGGGVLPIIDAGVPLTQNKISARNILCIPPSTWLTREGRGRKRRREERGGSFHPPGILCALLTAASLSGSGCPPCLQPPREPVSLLHANSIRGRGTRGEYRIMTPEGSGKKRRTRKGTREPKETKDGHRSKEGKAGGGRGRIVPGSRGFPFYDAIASSREIIKIYDPLCRSRRMCKTESARGPRSRARYRERSSLGEKFSASHFANALLSPTFLLLYVFA